MLRRALTGGAGVRRKPKIGEGTPHGLPTDGFPLGLECDIQHLYANGFASVWEYACAQARGEIPWTTIIGACCPVCGRVGDYREIQGYRRGVATLLPPRQGSVEITRFLCRETGRTFSMLPGQLVPYHRYTADSILVALLLAAELTAEGRPGLWRAVHELPPDALLSPWQLRRWLTVAVRGLRRAHTTLNQGRDLSHVRSGPTVADHLAEVTAYVSAFQVRDRGPPGPHAVGRLLRHHQHRSSHFLLGTPSQQRGR